MIIVRVVIIFFLTEKKFVQEDAHFTDSVWVITEGKGPET